MADIASNDSDLIKSVDEKGTISFRNGRGDLHREDGPAVEWSTGTRFWYRSGRRHRENGPAIEWETGGREWFVEGRHHRLDGPAIELPDGRKSWYVDGTPLSEDEFKAIVSPANPAAS